MSAASELKWQPLELFGERFRSNLAALETRDPNLAQRLRNLTVSPPFFVAAQGDDVFLGRPGPAGMEVVSNPLPPVAAMNLVGGMFPSGHVTFPLVVGGLAYGWLWDRITRLPCKVETAPGLRPPIYFLTGNLERLWAVLHIMDWRQMLADQRFVLIVGPDAVSELRDLLIQDPALPRPRLAVRVEQDLWKEDFDSLTQSVAVQTDQMLNEVAAQLRAAYPPVQAEDLAARFRSGGLRVLGVTSRYTTFLQYSMRDWLAAFERLGHDTRLLIEPADHLVCGQYACAKAVLDYRPDLIVVIDHYRAELGPLPDTVPCVMWVQDRLPNIYSIQGGQNQKRLDYCLGFGRLHLSSRYGYSTDRFLSCPVGINDERMAGVELTPADIERYGCDVSYVGHASTPASQIVREYVQRSGSPEIARLCDDLYQRLEAWYAGGRIAISEVTLTALLNQSMEAARVELRPQDTPEFMNFFHHRVNNAMFRHQSLQWLSDLGVNLHLWGNGWESHPTLARHARGPADNHADLPKIYRASKINLQVTPHGSVHQRLMDGLVAGGFFLLRWHPGDGVGRIYRDLLAWCRRHNVQSDAELYAKADDRIRGMIERINYLEGSTPQTRVLSVFDVMNGHADSDFMTSADSVWDEYENVAFNTRDELSARLAKFLPDEEARREVATSMRRVVVDRASYVSITGRLLNLIRRDQEMQGVRCAA